MKQVLLTLTCLLSSVPACASQQAAPIERGWIIVREDLELYLEPATGELLLEGTLLARLEHDENSIGPMLALNSRAEQMVFDEITAPGAEVELNTYHPDMSSSLVSVLTFDQPKQRGDEVLISFVCHKQRDGRQFVVHESIALASWVAACSPSC